MGATCTRSLNRQIDSSEYQQRPLTSLQKTLSDNQSLSSIIQKGFSGCSRDLDNNTSNNNNNVAGVYHIYNNPCGCSVPTISSYLALGFASQCVHYSTHYSTTSLTGDNLQQRVPTMTIARHFDATQSPDVSQANNCLQNNSNECTQNFSQLGTTSSVSKIITRYERRANLLNKKQLSVNSIDDSSCWAAKSLDRINQKEHPLNNKAVSTSSDNDCVIYDSKYRRSLSDNSSFVTGDQCKCSFPDDTSNNIKENINTSLNANYNLAKFEPSDGTVCSNILSGSIGSNDTLHCICNISGRLTSSVDASGRENKNRKAHRRSVRNQSYPHKSLPSKTVSGEGRVRHRSNCDASLATLSKQSSKEAIPTATTTAVTTLSRQSTFDTSTTTDVTSLSRQPTLEITPPPTTTRLPPPPQQILLSSQSEGPHIHTNNPHALMRNKTFPFYRHGDPATDFLRLV